MKIAYGLKMMIPTTNKWTLTRVMLPPEGIVVETMISDECGVRNEGTLKRNGNLFFLPDGSMYVYYTPTHWRPIQK